MFWLMQAIQSLAVAVGIGTLTNFIRVEWQLQGNNKKKIDYLKVQSLFLHYFVLIAYY